jgi:hypothetical protein
VKQSSMQCSQGMEWPAGPGKVLKSAVVEKGHNPEAEECIVPRALAG